MGREEGGFAGCLLWVKQASSARCQRWYRMCRGSRGTRSLYMESRPQPFALRVKSKFQLAPSLLSRAEGMQAHGPAMTAGASLVGVLASGGRLGGLFTPTSLAGTVQSLGSQWVFLLRVLHQGCKDACEDTA